MFGVSAGAASVLPSRATFLFASMSRYPCPNLLQTVLVFALCSCSVRSGALACDLDGSWTYDMSVNDGGVTWTNTLAMTFSSDGSGELTATSLSSTGDCDTKFVESFTWTYHESSAQGGAVTGTIASCTINECCGECYCDQPGDPFTAVVNFPNSDCNTLVVDGTTFTRDTFDWWLLILIVAIVAIILCSLVVCCIVILLIVMVRRKQAAAASCTFPSATDVTPTGYGTTQQL